MHLTHLAARQYQNSSYKTDGAIKTHKSFQRGYTAPYGSIQPRRTLSGRLARKGTKKAALLRAESKNSDRKVPFKDAINAMPAMERAESIHSTMEQYMVGDGKIGLRDLEDIIQTLALQTEQTMMQACAFLLRNGFFFSIIKVSYTNSHLHRKLLRDLRLLLEIDEDNREEHEVLWNWHSLDCELFVRQFQSLLIISHYKNIRRQLMCLGKQGEIALIRIERDMLLKVINDFLDQLGPDSARMDPSTPLTTEVNSMISTRTMGTQTAEDMSSSIQMVQEDCCKSKDLGGAIIPYVATTTRDLILINNGKEVHLADSHEDASEKMEMVSKNIGAEEAASAVEKHEELTVEGQIPAIGSDRNGILKDGVAEGHQCSTQEASTAQQELETTPRVQSQSLGGVGDDPREKNQASMAIICFQGDQTIKTQGNEPVKEISAVAAVEKETCESNSLPGEGSEKDAKKVVKEPAADGGDSRREEDPIEDAMPIAASDSCNSTDLKRNLEFDGISKGHDENQVTLRLAPGPMEDSLQVILEPTNLDWVESGPEEGLCHVTLELRGPEKESIAVLVNPCGMAAIKDGQGALKPRKQISESNEEDSTKVPMDSPKSSGALVKNISDSQDSGSTGDVSVCLISSDQGISLALTLQVAQMKGVEQDPPVTSGEKELGNLTVKLVPHGETVSLLLGSEEMCETDTAQSAAVSSGPPTGPGEENVDSEPSPMPVAAGDADNSLEPKIGEPELCGEVGGDLAGIKVGARVVERNMVVGDISVGGEEEVIKAVDEGGEGDRMQVDIAVDESNQVHLTLRDKAESATVLASETDKVSGQSLIDTYGCLDVKMLADDTGHVSVLIGSTAEIHEDLEKTLTDEEPKIRDNTQEEQLPVNVTMTVGDSDLVSVTIRDSTMKLEESDSPDIKVGAQPTEESINDQEGLKTEAAVEGVKEKEDGVPKMQNEGMTQEVLSTDLPCAKIEDSSTHVDSGPEENLGPLCATIVVQDDASTTLVLEVAMSDVNSESKNPHVEAIQKDVLAASEVPCHEQQDEPRGALDSSNEKKDSSTLGEEDGLTVDAKVQELAEEAALLEAQISEEAHQLQKEKENLEQHVGILMKALEEEQDARSRAPTPEDLEELQEHQKNLMVEIEAEKNRLSIVATSLAACFTSPRSDDGDGDQDALDDTQDRSLPDGDGEVVSSTDDSSLQKKPDTKEPAGDSIDSNKNDQQLSNESAEPSLSEAAVGIADSETVQPQPNATGSGDEPPLSQEHEEADTGASQDPVDDNKITPASQDDTSPPETCTTHEGDNAAGPSENGGNVPTGDDDPRPEEEVPASNDVTDVPNPADSQTEDTAVAVDSKAEAEEKGNDQTVESPVEAEKKEVAEEDAGVEETLQAFQKHLSQTKKIADVLQSCQKPGVVDPSNSEAATSPDGNLDPKEEDIAVSPEDAEKLAALTEELKKSPEFDEPATEAEIHKFAEYLGMDLKDDKEFLYIAEWALTAPLPAGWTIHLDSQGNEFYYNTVTKVSQYDHPMDGKYRELFQKSKAEKYAQQNQDSGNTDS